MSTPLIDKIVEAVLYEGYILYPYRPSVKNIHRWTFGGIYPRSYAESQKGPDLWRTQTQCLLIATPDTTLNVQVRFLHLVNRTSNDPSSPSWQEAVEQAVDLDPLTIPTAPHHRGFSFPAIHHTEPQITRDRYAIEGSIDISTRQLTPSLFRLTLQITNDTRTATLSRDAALMHSLVSAHAIFTLTHGQFISLTDPPEPYRQAAAECRNIGVWPVLVGEEGQRDTLLASPIILPDYPQVAPESPGTLFDSTEIDEILTLRILTLTDEEKRQAAAIDPRIAALLARTESLSQDQFMSLHGVLRSPRAGLMENPHA